jgi:hypothetical protein
MSLRQDEDFLGSYPTMQELLGSAFQNAICRGVGKPTDKFAQILELLNGNKRSGQELEDHLKLVVASVGIDKARQAYASKLSSAPTLTVLEDYCFEIEVAARASQILDKGSIILEHPIPRIEDDGPGENNSDVFGNFNGVRVRIDATVFRGQTRGIQDDISILSPAPRYIQEEIYSEENGEITERRLPDSGARNVFTPDRIRDPVSKTIRDRLEEKLRQCEQGTISLIAFKTRYPQHQSDLKDALFGAIYGVEVTPLVDADGRPVSCEEKLIRVDQAPFSKTENQYTDSFKVMSGVWCFPAYREDFPETLLNPHATMPVPDRLAESLRTGDSVDARG